MSHKLRSVMWLVLIMTIASLALIAGRPRILAERWRMKPVMVPRPSVAAQDKTSVLNGPRLRSLSLQPEAFNMGRRLGARFSASKLETSTLVGTLTTGSERRTMQTARIQTDKGEQVVITFAGSTSLLTWDAAEGAVSSGIPASGSDRELIERLVFDSPDQFVLAQLRGASYYTIARNVRAEGAADDYSGPLWNVVRVDDPQTDETKRPQSRWRLYYLNATTGLIDRIVSEVQGQQVTVEFKWTETGGEKVPAQITWTRQGRTLMQYQLTTFAHAQTEGVK